jgi:hypothetical protein
LLTPKSLLRWLPPFGWMLLIFFLSTDHLSLPELRRTLTGFLAAKAVHLTEFAVLCLLWYRAIGETLSRWKLSTAAFAFFLTSIYGWIDEFHQSLTLFRRGRASDALLDSVGALISLVGLWAMLRPGAPFGHSRQPSAGETP